MKEVAKTVKVLTLHAEKCKGCKKCEEACSEIHFKTKHVTDTSALRIMKNKDKYTMYVCDQRGLCIDLCPVGALSRKKNGVVWLDKNSCIGCQACVGFCPIGGMRKSDLRIQPFKCISCGACVRACPEHALELVDKKIDDLKEIVYYKLGVEQV